MHADMRTNESHTASLQQLDEETESVVLSEVISADGIKVRENERARIYLWISSRTRAHAHTHTHECSSCQ
jgi:hypothetical protein